MLLQANLFFFFPFNYPILLMYSKVFPKNRIEIFSSNIRSFYFCLKLILNYVMEKFKDGIGFWFFFHEVNLSWPSVVLNEWYKSSKTWTCFSLRWSPNFIMDQCKSMKGFVILNGVVVSGMFWIMTNFTLQKLFIHIIEHWWKKTSLDIENWHVLI